MADRDYTKCDVCGVPYETPDKMHVLIDNGRLMRHTYCHRRHRYVAVKVPGVAEPIVQTRTDLEIESLAMKFRMGELALGWE